MPTRVYSSWFSPQLNHALVLHDLPRTTTAAKLKRAATKRRNIRARSAK